MKTSRRLIVGCGYLGMPTATTWLERGDEVTVLTRDADRFRSKFADIDSINMIRLITGDVTETHSLEPLAAQPPFDTVLFAVGMDRSRYRDIFSVYVEGLKNVIDRLHPQTRHLIYISSTGVYGKLSSIETVDENQAKSSETETGVWIDESTPAIPDRDGGRACLQAESLLQNSLFADRVSILRFAGIYGPHRIPLLDAIRQQQWNRLSDEGYLNLIHVDDGANIIVQVADHADCTARQIILVSDGQPVHRRTFYDYLASRVGVGTIPWDELNRSRTIEDTAAMAKPSIEQPEKPEKYEKGPNRRTSHKKVCNQKLTDLLGYEFKFPNYRAGLIIPAKDRQGQHKRDD